MTALAPVTWILSIKEERDVATEFARKLLTEFTLRLDAYATSLYRMTASNHS